MRILLLATAFNGLTQRVYDELVFEKHQLSLCLAGDDQRLRHHIARFEPELILCPFLKHRIPDDVWQAQPCIVIHPGIRGDRGPSSLDWAIIDGESDWGVTALQADAEMDAGDIWSSHEFEMRPATKASLYRQEVTAAAVRCVHEILSQMANSALFPESLDYADPSVRGRERPLLKQSARQIDWQSDTTDVIVNKIRAADSFPGVLDSLCGMDVYLFDVHPEAELKAGKPKQILAQHQGAICLSTIDGAVWIGQLKSKRAETAGAFKLPASWVLQDHLEQVPTLSMSAFIAPEVQTFHEIRFRRSRDSGYLYFNFHNGAMGTEQCQRLLAAYRQVQAMDLKAIVLMGGEDFWSNGIHLNHIERANSPVDESWNNINAINDIVQAILETTDKLTIAALGGNAGAGGVMMALACDEVVAREGVILNPHYKSMGLFGSEYWTYSLPKRVGLDLAEQLTNRCLPIGARRAQSIGMIDKVLPERRETYERQLHQYVTELAEGQSFRRRIDSKATQRFVEIISGLLGQHRQQELAEMKVCFRSDKYHDSRKGFVYKQRCTGMPHHLLDLSDFIVGHTPRSQPLGSNKRVVNCSDDLISDLIFA